MRALLAAILFTVPLAANAAPPLNQGSDPMFAAARELYADLAMSLVSSNAQLEAARARIATLEQQLKDAQPKDTPSAK